jgi:DNA-binding transcriptional ArsR family regulator
MVKQNIAQLDRTFFALSDKTRRAIIGNLAIKDNCSVLELAEPFNMSLPAISKHLKVLENAKLIGRTRNGRVHSIKLHAQPMFEANDWLIAYKQFWTDHLDSLEQYLNSQAHGE